MRCGTNCMPLQFEARKVALKQDRTGFILTLSLHPDEIPDDLMRDFVGTRYACAFVRINDDETPAQHNNRVQQAGMLCRNPEFQRHIGATSEDEAADILCSKCGISSRTELHGNKQAQVKFDEIVGGFDDFF